MGSGWNWLRISGLCPVGDFVISGVETLATIAGELRALMLARVCMTSALSVFSLFWHCLFLSGSIVSDCRLDDQGLIPDGQRIFLLAPAFRPAAGPTQPPIQWVPGVLSLGVKHSRGVMLTTHSPLVPRSRMSRSYPPPASMACSGTAYCTLPYFCHLFIKWIKQISGIVVYAGSIWHWSDSLCIAWIAFHSFRQITMYHI
jgi:hypothetical protein